MDTKVLHPGELTQEQLKRWRAAHAADPLLAQPTFSPDFAVACGEMRPRTRVAVVTDDAGRQMWFGYELAGRRGAEALGYGVSDQQGFVAEPGFTCDPAELLRACGLPYHRFHGLHPLAHPFGTSPPRSFVDMGRTPNPVVDLPNGWDAYLADLKRRSRSTLPRVRRHERRLGDIAPVRFVFDETDPAALREMVRLKSEQFHRNGYPNPLARPGEIELLEHLLRRPSESCTSTLSVLYAGDRPVAFWLSMRSQSLLAARYTTYDPEFSRFSPGLVLLLKVMERAAGLGMVLVDIGTGDQSYKRTLMTRELAVIEGALVRAHPVGLALAAADGANRFLRDFITDRPALRRATVDGLHRYGAWRSARRGMPEVPFLAAGGSSASSATRGTPPGR